MKGQSLIELLIAAGIFVVIVSAAAFLLIDSYISNLQASQNSQAISLAEEGLEAARSIRDNNWYDLTLGDHGLSISQDQWIFQGEEENVSDKLPGGVRKVIVENIGDDRKKVTSQITWKLTETNLQSLSLITYLTNWQRRAD